jgi:hypothetical protein
VDALRRELTLAPQVVVVVRVASVDHHVVAAEQRRKLLECLIDQRRRHHDPDRAWRVELLDQVCERACGDRAMFCQRLCSARIYVVDDALLFRAQQASNHVRAHAA